MTTCKWDSAGLCPVVVALVALASSSAVGVQGSPGSSQASEMHLRNVRPLFAEDQRPVQSCYF